MQEIKQLEDKNKKQIANINYLWDELLELQSTYKQRNNTKKYNFENKFTYTIFISILPYLNIRDWFKLRLLNSSMKEISTNYLMQYLFEQKQIADQLQLNINEEKEQLPHIYKEILDEKITKTFDYVKKILFDEIKESHQYPPSYYLNNPILLMQVAECEGIEIQNFLPNKLYSLKHTLVFLDFSKLSIDRRKQLLEFYEQRINETVFPEKIETAFMNLAIMWLKQSFYQNTYPKFTKIMKLIKEYEILKQRITQLKRLKKKERKQNRAEQQ